MIRLGRWQRRLVRRCLGSSMGLVYPLGKREVEARNALVARGLLVQADGLPGAFRIATDALAIHLNGAVLQHREDDQ